MIAQYTTRDLINPVVDIKFLSEIGTIPTKHYNVCILFGNKTTKYDYIIDDLVVGLGL